MGKYGKKVSISLNPLDYNITILGESGIGKTTLAKECCEKLVGDEGYIHFDIGNEDGAAAIEGIISEKIEDYAKLTEVVEDIVENKDSDYPDLKVVIWDTLDELVPIVEAETIRQHNKKHADKKVDSINSAMGSFGKGQDFAISLMIQQMSALRSVGVSNIIIGHVKRSDIIDPITQQTYSKLTADTTQRYFNAIKNKQHFVALAYIDREIVQEKTGRKNVVTNKEITVNKAVSEGRVISFRDDTYSVDSKSRFANIIDRVSFGVEEFISAMQDAIENEKTSKGVSLAKAEKEQVKREKAKAENATKASEDARAKRIAEEMEAERSELIELIQNAFINTEKANKDLAKAKLKENGVGKFSELPVEVLKEVYEIVK